MPKEIVLKLCNINKGYCQGRSIIEVLKSVNLSVYSGEIIGIIGASGSGKSTLLHIAGLLDDATNGVVEIMGLQTSNMSESRKNKVRLQSLGFIYQQHHLLPEFTARENIALPRLIAKKNYSQALEDADNILSELGLKNHNWSFPSSLSGGEQQRVAIARALINNPKIVLADEPTGNLDPKTANEVFQLLLNFVKQYNAAVICVTHDRSLASQMDKLYQLDHGYLKFI